MPKKKPGQVQGFPLVQQNAVRDWRCEITIGKSLAQKNRRWRVLLDPLAADALIAQAEDNEL